LPSGPRPDRRRLIVVAFAEKHTIGPQSNVNKPPIPDQDLLQTKDFIEGKFVFPGLQHGLAPTFVPVARRPLPFDFKAGTAVGQQQKARGARDDVRARPPQNFRRFLGQAALRKLFELLGAAKDWTVGAVSQKVVAHTVAARQVWFPCKVGIRIDKVHRRHAWVVRNVQDLPRQQFIQIPGSPGRYARRRGLDEPCNDLGTDGSEDSFQHQKIKILVPESEIEMDALTPLLAYSVDTKLGVFRINESKAELIVAVAGLSICTSSGAREQRTHTATRQAFPDPLSGLPVADDADLYVLGIRPRRRMV